LTEGFFFWCFVLFRGVCILRDPCLSLCPPVVHPTTCVQEEHEEILRKKVNPDALLTWEEASSMPYTLKVWNLLVATFLMFSVEDFFLQFHSCL
jgi:hypothetical protein